MTLFHMILPSNSSMNTFLHNKATHYVTTLSKRIELNGDWEVALSEILFQRTWYHILEDDAQHTYVEHYNAGQRRRYVSSRRLSFLWI